MPNVSQMSSWHFYFLKYLHICKKKCPWCFNICRTRKTKRKKCEHIQIVYVQKITRAVICMHLCLCKTLSKDCPHGEVAFSNSDINKKTMRNKNLSNCIIHVYYG